MSYNIEELFKIADNNLKVNTAYPIFKESFKKYISNNDIFENVDKLSFYIHVPFCKQLCKFCEYTKFLAGNENSEEKYLTLLNNQIENFINNHDIKKIYGFDIGGGTPTALSDKNFEKLINIHLDLENRYEKINDYEKSIEISFSTINDNKIDLIKNANFNRISVGMQSINKKLLDDNNRYYSQIEDILKIKEMIQNKNIEKLNIDLMYGLTNQNDDMLQSTIEAIKIINPEQVTLYETRFNRNNMDYSKITRDLQYEQYSNLYNELIKLGYKGRFGKNTFTKTNDEGVSSYLKYRMTECIPYKGFGISAQSMSLQGLSYGIMKNTDLKYIPDLNEIKEGYNYSLPKSEIAAKYISIAMYNGSFNLDVLNGILQENAKKYFKEEFDYLFKNEYISEINNEIILTQKGFRYYGAICSLFWSNEQNEELLKNKI